MGVLFALCVLRVSNQGSWRITHTLVRNCLNTTKSSRANIAQRWRQCTAGQPTEVLCGQLGQVKGQPIVRDRRRKKKGRHAPLSVQHLVTNDHVNNVCRVPDASARFSPTRKSRKNIRETSAATTITMRAKRGCAPLNLLVDFHSVQDSSRRCAGQTQSGWVLRRTSTFELPSLTYFNGTAFQTQENHFKKCHDIQLKTAAKHKRQSKRPHGVRSTSHLHLLQRCVKGIRGPNALTDCIREKTSNKP